MPAPTPAPASPIDIEIAALERMLAISEEVEKRSKAESLPLWRPQPGPQSIVWHLDCDEIGYGGAAFGSKTATACALPMQRIQMRGYRALILRRQAVDLTKIRDECTRIYLTGGGTGEWEYRAYAPTEMKHVGGNVDWFVSTKWGSRIELSHCNADDDYRNKMGNEWDDIIFDELSHFTLKQYTSIISRRRGTIHGIRRRALSTMNPPEAGEPGNEWIRARWGPWVDENFELPDWEERDPKTGAVVRGKGLPPRFEEAAPEVDRLRDVLHVRVLQGLVDAATFERAEGVLAEGSVEAVEREGDELRAVVHGGAAYETRLAAQEDELRCSCTCPQGQLGRACKHAVALGLAWLAANPAPISAETRRVRLPPAASAQILYVAQVGHGESVRERFSTEPFTWKGARAQSRTFVLSLMTDNKAGLAAEPDYASKLRDLDPVRAEQLEKGNWAVKPAAGLYFKCGWFEIVEEVPTGRAEWYRRWDLAATVPTRENPDPDWTEGPRAAMHENSYLYVDDLASCREDPGGVDAFIRDTIRELDGIGVVQIFPIDPGAAGKKEAVRLAQLAEREGAPAETEPERGAKSLRIRFLSSVCSPKTNDRAHTTHDGKPSDRPLGRVKLVKGPGDSGAWIERFLRQAESWEPRVSDQDLGHDDILDALAGLARRYTQGDGTAAVGIEVIGGGRAA